MRIVHLNFAHSYSVHRNFVHRNLDHATSVHWNFVHRNFWSTRLPSTGTWSTGTSVHAELRPPELRPSVLRPYRPGPRQRSRLSVRIVVPSPTSSDSAYPFACASLASAPATSMRPAPCWKRVAPRQRVGGAHHPHLDVVRAQGRVLADHEGRHAGSHRRRGAGAGEHEVARLRVGRRRRRVAGHGDQVLREVHVDVGTLDAQRDEPVAGSHDVRLGVLVPERRADRAVVGDGVVARAWPSGACRSRRR